MFASVSARPPGFPAAPSTGARVVAANGSSVSTFVADGSSCGLSGAANRAVPPQQQFADHIFHDDANLSYEPYVHVRTGDRAFIPVRVEPETSGRRVLALIPAGYQSAQVHHFQQNGNAFLDSLRRCFGPPAAPAQSPVSAEPRPAQAAPFISPIVANRRLPVPLSITTSLADLYSLHALFTCYACGRP